MSRGSSAIHVRAVKNGGRAAIDAELVLAAQRGEVSAFSQLVARNYTAVCSYALALTGSPSRNEEIAQEAFVVAWRRLAQLREPDKFRTWIFSIARNVTLHVRRSERDVIPLTVRSRTPATEIPSSDPSPLERAISRQEEMTLSRALSAIPEIYRLPLVLYYREDKDLEAVARALGLSPTNTRQRLWKGRKLLQQEVLSLLECVLARSLPSRQIVSGAVAVMAAQATSQAMAGIRETALRPRPELRARLSWMKAAMSALGTSVLCVAAYAVASKTGATTPPGLLARAEGDPASGAKAPLPIFQDVISTPATGRIAGSLRSDEKTVISFDFEEGTLPALFRSGYVVPCPAGSPSRFCALATVDVNSRWYVVEIGVDSLGIFYQREAVLSFDYWVGENPPNPMTVSVANGTQGKHYNFWLRHHVANAWNHAELPLSSFVIGQESPDRHQEEGDHLQRIEIYGDRAGGGPLFVDNLRLSMVPPEKQTNPGSPLEGR